MNFHLRNFSIGMLPSIGAGETSKTDSLHRASALTPLNLLRIRQQARAVVGRNGQRH